jgi:hypothetical protein
MRTSERILNVVFVNNDTFFLDCFDQWIFVDVKTSKSQSNLVNGCFQSFGGDRSIAYAFRDGSVISVNMVDKIIKDYEVLAINQRLVGVFVSSKNDRLFFIASERGGNANNAIGSIHLPSMKLLELWPLDDDECCSSMQPTLFGDCFLTGYDERISTTRRLRNAHNGKIVWESPLSESTPIGVVDRIVQTNYQRDRGTSVVLRDYKGNEIANQQVGEVPILVTASWSGKYYAVVTRDDWSINLSQDGRVVLGGNDSSRILFSTTGDFAARLFGIGKRNQQLEVIDLSSEELPSVVQTKPPTTIFRNVSFSNDHKTLVLFNESTSKEYDVIAISS